jgi:hypothetical protein
VPTPFVRNLNAHLQNPSLEQSEPNIKSRVKGFNESKDSAKYFQLHRLFDTLTHHDIKELETFKLTYSQFMEQLSKEELPVDPSHLDYSSVAQERFQKKLFEQSAFLKFSDTILAAACRDLLDEKGEIHPEIMQSLALNPPATQSEKDEMMHSLLCSYSLHYVSTRITDTQEVMAGYDQVKVLAHVALSQCLGRSLKGNEGGKLGPEEITHYKERIKRLQGETYLAELKIPILSYDRVLMDLKDDLSTFWKNHAKKVSLESFKQLVDKAQQVFLSKQPQQAQLRNALLMQVQTLSKEDVATEESRKEADELRRMQVDPNNPAFAPLVNAMRAGAGVGTDASSEYLEHPLPLPDPTPALREEALPSSDGDILRRLGIAKAKKGVIVDPQPEWLKAMEDAIKKEKQEALLQQAQQKKQDEKAKEEAEKKQFYARVAEIKALKQHDPRDTVVFFKENKALLTQLRKLENYICSTPEGGIAGRFSRLSSHFEKEKQAKISRGYQERKLALMLLDTINGSIDLEKKSVQTHVISGLSYLGEAQTSSSNLRGIYLSLANIYNDLAQSQERSSRPPSPGASH